MKVCPACRTTFDDSQNFCLTDGTPLVTAEAEPETETVVVQRESSVPPRSYQSLPRTPAASSAAPTAKKSNTGLIVAGALAAVLLIAIVAGAWRMMSRGSQSDNGNQQIAQTNADSIPNSNFNSNLNLNSSSAPRNYPPADVKNSTNAANANPATTYPSADVLPSGETRVAEDSPPPPPPEPARNIPARRATTIHREVSSTINSWARAIESGDLNRHLSYYADTLEYYYTARGFSVNQVRADKQRAFEAFDDIEFNVSNLRVITESEDRVTIIYDKEWVFANGERTTEGKVQSQLTLQRINGRWLIVGERDLKVYYQQSR
ncbi:MAG TPA: nuclear transport factor 2 family protein [Pyrinomonadaceae bacterium]|jgi:ketosteroid isomerase-like protein